MAYNEILVGRLPRSLAALYGIKGDTPSPTLAGEIMPVHLLEEAAEHRFLEGWNRYAAFNDQTGSAGNNSYIYFSNPATSGVIAVIEKLKFSIPVGAANSAVQLAMISPAIAPFNVAASIPLDQRQFLPTAGFLGGAACSLSRNSGVLPNAFTFDIYPFSGAGSQIFDILFSEHQEIVIIPNVSLIVEFANANLELQATMWWRERVLEQSELR